MLTVAADFNFKYDRTEIQFQLFFCPAAKKLVAIAFEKLFPSMFFHKVVPLRCCTVYRGFS